MLLKLEVVGAQANRLGEQRSKIFETEGGTIGRVPGNDWVLPDQLISSRHAAIQYADGQFYVIDTNSYNGVFLNAPNLRLQQGRPYPINTGDRLLIHPFDIQVSVIESSAAQEEASSDTARPETQSVSHAATSLSSRIPSAAFDPFVAEEAMPCVGTMPAPNRRVAEHDESIVPRGSDQAEEPVDPLDALGLRKTRQPLPQRASPAPPAPLPMTSTPPPPQGSPPLPAPPPGANTPASSSPAAGQAQLDFAALLAAAGLQGLPVTPELSASFGSILRTVVDGLRDVLRAREELKNQFRLRITSVAARENNPIKFSANTEDALHNLLVRHNPAYLEPVAAFESAFDDLRIHQMAMFAGLRAGYQAMLTAFDPVTLEQKFGRYARRGGLLSASAKPRYWDLYREVFEETTSDPDDSFSTLFGTAFSKAYEEQTRLLKQRSGAR
jgi:type VI secretion system FHA domain protein